ncbi:MAG TPA: sodium:solute symporter family protein [Acidobacteriota bacterium]|nr:sodium:solute symporter family protein [Acidobacteriota bacterium]
MNIYFAVILIYLLALVGVAVWQGRGLRSQEDFSVAGRTLSPLVLFGTMLATWIGTGSIFGNAERTYEVGIATLIIPLSSVFGVIVLYFLAGRVRLTEQITIQDLLEQRYNATARVLGVITMTIAYITIVSYQYRAAGAVLHIVWDPISDEVASAVAAAFIILFTAIAGMKSIANIGLIQGITMIVGITVTLPMLFFRAGGVDGIRQALEPSHLEIFGPIGWIGALNLLLPSFFLILGDANMYQRFLSARDAGVAKLAVLWCVVGIGFMEVTIILTGWVGSALKPGLENPGYVIAEVSKEFLPTAVGALMLTTIMAIVLSTAGSYLLAPGTALIRDVYERFIYPEASGKHLVLMLRITTLVLGLAAFGISQLDDKFLEVALHAYTIYGAGITPALLAVFFWKRATAQGAVASIFAGTGVTLLWEYWLKELFQSSMGAVLPAVAISVLMLWLVSMLTPPPRKEKYEPFFAKK